MDCSKLSSTTPTNEDQGTSKEYAVQLDSGKPYLRYPLRNRMRQLQQNVQKEVLELVVTSDGFICNSAALKPSDSGANVVHQPSDEILKGGSFDLAELLASNRCLKSVTSVPLADNQCSIHNLPTEVLTMIFSYLTVEQLSVSVAPVCRYWYSLAHSPYLWRSLTFKGQTVPLSEVKRLLRKSCLLSSLCIKDRHDTGKIISQICQSNKNIRSLSIHRVGGVKTLPFSWKTLLAKHLHQLLRRCPGITKLILKDITIRSKKFYQELGHSLPNLTCLSLSHSHLLNPSNIAAVADGCRNLKVLWLSGDCQCWHNIQWEEAFRKIFRNLSGTLTHLQFDASKLSDPGFEDLSRCQELRVLMLNKAVHVSTTAMTSINSLKKLQYLSIHKSHYTCPIENPYPFESATFNLAYLSLPENAFVNDGFAEVLSKHCPQLRGVCLAFSHVISDTGVMFIVQGCQQLHYLDLYLTSAVKGHCFKAFPLHAPKLHLLLIDTYCDAEREFHVKWLVDNCPQIKVERASKWITGKKKCCAELKRFPK